MDSDTIDIILGFGGLIIFVLALVGAFAAGTLVERAHYREIRDREDELRDIMIFAVRTPPPHLADHDTTFVCGSVVIGMDYFKMTLAKLRNLVGGRVGSYETLFDRARREAVLRMKAEARALRADCVLNIKFSTANVMSGSADNKGSGCVEVIAYGTACIPRRR